MCCGRSRGQIGRGLPVVQASRPMAGAGRAAGLTFEYVGRTGLVVAGPVTGRQYRFDRPGSRLEVDPRDSASVGAIQTLRRVGPPAPRR